MTNQAKEKICKVNGEKCYNKMDCIDCYIFEGFEGKEMTNQAKEKTKEWLDKWWEDKTICDFNTDVAWEMVDIALQEQAKEIKKDLKERCNLIDKVFNIFMFDEEDWDKFWEKYGVKEEEGK